MRRTPKTFRAAAGNRIAEVRLDEDTEWGAFYGGLLIGHELEKDAGNNVFFSFRQLPKFIKWLQLVEKEYNKKGKKS